MKTSKQLTAVSLTAAMLCGILTGCGSTAQTESEPVVLSAEETVEPTGKTVGISLPSAESGIWAKEGEYLQEHFTKRGYEISLSYAEDSSERQNTEISNMIAAECDLLIIAPVDAYGLTESLAAALEADIPVLSLGTLIMNTKAVSCAVLGDDYRIGELEAQAVIDGLQLKEDGKNYNIEFTAGDPDDVSSGLIFNGVYDTLETYLKSGALQVASGEGTFTQSSEGAGEEASAERMTRILDETYRDGTKLHAVVGGTDAEAVGAAQALVSYSGNDVLLCGSGATDEAMALIVDGRQTMTVFTAVYEEAIAAVDIGISLMNDEATDSYVIDHSSWDFECRYDTASYNNNLGIVPAFLIEPEAVTKANYQELLVDQGYYVMDGKYPKAVG